MKQLTESINIRFCCYLILWGILDLLCASFCEIHADEAYYRLYGQYLDWGYYDHPPMVGLMAWISSHCVHGTSLILKNLSVRLTTVLLHMATVYLTWKAIAIPNRRDKNTINAFFLIAGAMVMFCAYGFMTTPDAPLLFFASLFYYAYRRYLESPSWKDALLLAISIAGMCYSKYMAILVVGFVVLSNVRLLKEVRLWGAIVLAIVLYFPHLYWQYSNNYPSLTYHLVDRATSYNWLYTLEYIPNQLVVFNPLSFCLMLWLSVRLAKSQFVFSRSMAWSILGFQIFFILASLRGHVEPHWTMVSSIPAIILLTEEWIHSAEGKQNLFSKRWVRQTMIGMFALVLVARIVLMANVLPSRTGLANKYPYYAAMHKVANGLPIVLDGSFQRPSLYRFYFDDDAYLVRQPNDRYTQYDLLHLEESLLGKKVCIMRHDDRNETIVEDGFSFEQRIVDKLQKEDLQ